MTATNFWKMADSGCRNSIFSCLRFTILTMPWHKWELWNFTAREGDRKTAGKIISASAVPAEAKGIMIC